jgi:hypothetical protein
VRSAPGTSWLPPRCGSADHGVRGPRTTRCLRCGYGRSAALNLGSEDSEGDGCTLTRRIRHVRWFEAELPVVDRSSPDSHRPSSKPCGVYFLGHQGRAAVAHSSSPSTSSHCAARRSSSTLGCASNSCPRGFAQQPEHRLGQRRLSRSSRWWWQVLDSNQRRRCRRFYRPLPLAARATCQGVHPRLSPRGGRAHDSAASRRGAHPPVRRRLVTLGVGDPPRHSTCEDDVRRRHLSLI